MMEAQAERDLAGFYVYQNYLKRLRRLHRNYVKKHCVMQKDQQGQKTNRSGDMGESAPPSFLPNSHLKGEPSFPSCTSSTGSLVTATGNGTNSGGDWPIGVTRFRIPVRVSQSLDSYVRPKKENDPPDASSRLPKLASSSRSSKADPSKHARSGHPLNAGAGDVLWDAQNPYEDHLGRKDNPIYIPCGRENSELRLQKRKLRKQRQKDESGALSFRMWRNVHGVAAATPYSM